MGRIKYFICIFIFCSSLIACSNRGDRHNTDLIINDYQDSVSANREFSSDLTSGQIQKLEDLCAVWGFLKYFHPIVRSGKYNWDRQLLHMIPIVMHSPSQKEFNNILNDWIDGLADDSISKNPTKVPLPTTGYKFKPDYGGIFDSKSISEEVKTKLSHFLLLSGKDNTSFYVHRGATGEPVFVNEPINYNITNVSVRLLALFRYWNIIEYYYPYRYLINSWKTVLRKFHSRICKSPDKG